MSNRELFEIINDYYRGKTMQIIPAYSTSLLPPVPVATYQVRDNNRSIVKIDERELDGEKIVIKEAVRTEEEILIKCYHKTDRDAYLVRMDLMDTIEVLSEPIRNAGYGIIELNTYRTAHEKTDTGYLYCYMFRMIIDYNNVIERKINKLKTIELVEDINEMIDIEEE